MNCAYVHAEFDHQQVVCTRSAELVNGIPLCWEHEPSDSDGGYVYAITWGDYVKVGWAQDPLARYRALVRPTDKTIRPPAQEGSMELVGAVPGKIITERAFHAVLDDDRAAGEWFKRSSAVERFVDYLKAFPTGKIEEKTEDQQQHVRQPPPVEF